MIFLAILIALQLLSVAYIECNSTIARNEINGSSSVNGSTRARHNRLHIKGSQNWEDEALYKYNVKIQWKIKPQPMKVLHRDEIGRIKDDWMYFKCSGVVINPSWVITAASCFQPYIRHLGKKFKEPMTIPLTDGLVRSDKQSRAIKNVHVHDLYKEFSMTTFVDIALVEVESRFNTDKTLHDHVLVARLARNIPYSPYKSGNNMRNCLVMSFGEDALFARPDFTQKLKAYDVRAAGPKYCEIIQRRAYEPWYTKTNGAMAGYSGHSGDMFDSHVICTTPFKWHDGDGGERLPQNEEGLGCYGEVGGALTCDESDLLYGVQSRTFGRYCDQTDGDTYTMFTSVGEGRVYEFIKKHIPDIGELANLADSQYPYKYRADDTSSTTTVPTCGGVILSLALSMIAVTS